MDLETTHNIQTVTIDRHILENVLETNNIYQIWRCYICGAWAQEPMHGGVEHCPACTNHREHHKYMPVMDLIWKELEYADLKAGSRSHAAKPGSRDSDVDSSTNL